jgi:cell division protein FtsL
MGEKARLTREVSILQGELQKKKLETQELSSLSRIAEVANLRGLSLRGVPLKVLAVGRNP